MKDLSTFYNTCNESGDKLKESKRKVVSQEVIILSYFIGRNAELSPSQTEQILRFRGFYWPITSIRRAITNLTRKKLLEKTDRQVIGKYKHKEYLWKLPK